jgi:group I intron endonuclease
MDKGKIYKITNTINGKIYIGCTITTLKKRYQEHLYRCFKTDYNSKLYNSIRKYGEKNFTIELITECDVDKIYETEKSYIRQYNSFKDGLNSTFGGEGCLGYVHSPEIRKKISKTLIDGNSHKGKKYDTLYGENGEIEKERRRESVKKHWGSLTIEERNERKENIKQANRNKSTHPIEFIKELKIKLKNGIKIKELSNQYPNIRKSFFYDLKNGRRWGDVN